MWLEWDGYGADTTHQRQLCYIWVVVIRESEQTNHHASSAKEGKETLAARVSFHFAHSNIRSNGAGQILVDTYEYAPVLNSKQILFWCGLSNISGILSSYRF